MIFLVQHLFYLRCIRNLRFQQIKIDFFHLRIFTEDKINEKNKLSRNGMKLKSKVENIISREVTFFFLCICIGMVSFFFSYKRQFLAFLS